MPRTIIIIKVPNKRYRQAKNYRLEIITALAAISRFNNTYHDEQICVKFETNSKETVIQQISSIDRAQYMFEIHENPEVGDATLITLDMSQLTVTTFFFN